MGREVFTAPWGYAGWKTMGQGSLGPGLATASCDKKHPPPPMSRPQGAAEEGKGFCWDPWDSAPNPHLEMGRMTVLCPRGAEQRSRCQVG